MPKFLFVYHGGSRAATEEELQAGMAAWGAWFGGMGAAIKDRGSPVGLSSTINSDGSTTAGGGANPASGYSVIEAADLAAAEAHAKGCPILSDGGSVEVAEIRDIGL
jgi:hypothetical protein